VGIPRIYIYCDKTVTCEYHISNIRVKHNADGSIECLKARIVAKGYSQCPGLDYNESFAPTFRPATLPIIMAMAAVEDLELRSVDITSAFMNDG